MSSIFYDTWMLKMYISHLHSHKRVPKDTFNQMLNAKNINFFLVLVIYIFAYSDILTKKVFSQNIFLINHACIQKINKFHKRLHYNDYIVLENAYYQNYRVPFCSFLLLLNKILIIFRHIGIYHART